MTRIISTYGDMWAVCISVHDPAAVTRWHNYGIDPTFCVLREEAVAYLEHGAAGTIVQPPYGNAATARNAALTAAFNRDLPCLLLDDDPEGWPYLVQPGEWPPGRVTWRNTALSLQERVHDHELVVGGCGVTTNPVHVGRETRLRARLTGGMMYIRPNSLSFDERLAEMEDIDYGLQHIDRFGGAVRADNLVTPFMRDDTPGRDEQREKCFDLMMKKWGDKIIHKPRSYNPYMIELADYGKRVKL